jgi:hypothetical protein
LIPDLSGFGIIKISGIKEKMPTIAIPASAGQSVIPSFFLFYQATP